MHFSSFFIDPPEQVAVSSLMVNVVENEFPDKVTCTAKGFPEPSYIWKFGNQTISSSAVLFLDHKLTRSKAGDYECIAMNRHGNISTKTIMNVQCKWEQCLREMQTHIGFISSDLICLSIAQTYVKLANFPLNRRSRMYHNTKRGGR